MYSNERVNVIGQCWECGKRVGIKYLKIMRIKELKTDKESNKIQVCNDCWDQLQTIDGIKERK